MIELTQINVYPVKSCKGTAMARAELTPFGLLNDRRWMVVDSEGVFVSQRSIPAMSLIEPSLSDSGLILKAPEMEPIEIPFQKDPDRNLTVRIWDDDCAALDCGDNAARWLTKFLGTNVRLVTRGNAFDRRVNPQYSQNRDRVGFADAFPLLLISSASLRDLNDRLDRPIPMNRFRPNLVVSGCEPYAEDRWKRVSFGGAIMSVCKPCSRCTIPTVDQSTGVRGTEPSTTLATYRRGPDGKVFFGQNLVNEKKSGELVLGMEVNVLA